MKKTLSILLGFCIHLATSAQVTDTTQVSGAPAIGPAFVFPVGAKFTIKLHPIDSTTSFHYSVGNYQDFHEFIDLKNTTKYFSNNWEENTIEAIFGIGTYGDTREEREKNFQSTLLLKNGTSYRLSYGAEIQEREKEKYEPTPVLPLSPHTISVEAWPYPIGLIALINFQIFDPNEIVKDSICLKNPNHTIAWGDSIFASEIEALKKGFLSKKGINIEDMRAYEKKIKSREPMFFNISYMQNDLYPNKNNYKLEIPRLFKRAECPTFYTDVFYYYTKDDKLVRSVLFEWNKLWGLEDVSYDRKLMAENRLHFKSKFNFIGSELTKLLGMPESRKIESDDLQMIKYEDLIKWGSSDGIHATLIHSGNDRERKIRLIIYKE